MRQTATTGNPGAEWREGWGIVLAAAIGVGLGGIFYHFAGAIMHLLQQAYGWSRGDIAFGVTLVTATHLLTNVPMGMLVDRFGARMIAFWGIFAFAISFSLLGTAGPDILSWYAGCVLFGIAGQGVSPLVWTGGVVRNFVRHRGMALALALTGGAVMVAITPSLVIWLGELVGVRQTFAVIGCGGGLLMLAVTYRYFRDRPVLAQSDCSASPSSPLTGGGYTVSETLRLTDFWKLAFAFTFVAICAGTFLVHIQPMLVDSGLTPAMAATVAFFIGPAMMVGRLCTGILFDYFDPRGVAALAFALPALGALMLLSLDGSYLMSALTGVVVGLCLGAEIDALAYMTSRYFGVRAYGKIYGIMTSCYSVGIGSGSALAGVMFDRYQSYESFLLALCLGSGLVLILVSTMKRPRDWSI
ncbi:MAG: MFS transporter [Porticoccaceae bacterium]